MKAFSLLPRQEIFYTYLSALSAKAALSARYLKNYVESPDAAAQEKIGGQIAECRAQSKEIMNNMTGELCRSFITPFDREDIQNFSQNLYRIPKMIEKVVERMELHGFSGIKDDFVRQVSLIVDEAAATENMVDDLIHKRNTKQVMQKVDLLHDLEQTGDDVLHSLLRSLFLEEKDVKKLILRKDIYDMLEKVIDSYRNAANVALQIVLKYS